MCPRQTAGIRFLFEARRLWYGPAAAGGLQRLVVNRQPVRFASTWKTVGDVKAGPTCVEPVMGALQIRTGVTDGRRAHATLQASAAQLSAAFESVPAGVAVLDTAGRIVIANTEYQHFLPSGIMPSRISAMARSRSRRRWPPRWGRGR